MAYKWVDETKLNAALTASADAIREKTGDTAQINFDMENETGFESAIEEIPSGGGGTAALILEDFDSDGFPTKATIAPNKLSLRPAAKNGAYGFSHYLDRITTLSAGSNVITIANKYDFAGLGTEGEGKAQTVDFWDDLITIKKGSGLTSYVLAGMGYYPPNIVDMDLGQAGYLIHPNAFSGDIHIPASVKTIGQVGGSRSYPPIVYFDGVPESIGTNAFDYASVTDIYVPWAEGEVANAPWGATSATIHYNHTPEV